MKNLYGVNLFRSTKVNRCFLSKIIFVLIISLLSLIYHYLSVAQKTDVNSYDTALN